MKILIASPIHADALAELGQHHDVIRAFDASQAELKSLIADREVLIFRSGVQITAEVMRCAPDLKLLLRAGSGIDNIDLNYVRQHNLQLVRIPSPGAKAVAEMSFALMLNLARNILQADQLWRQGHWVKHQMTGYSLSGKVLGIIGAGNIGARTGQLGVAWGMKVLGCVEFPSAARAAELREMGIRLTDCEEVLAKSDFVSVHVPLKATTRNLIDAQALSRMKQGAYLVNLARGGVVNEADLYQALTNGHLRGAALDVHEHEGEGKISPLVELKNVILTPHIGASTYDSQREIGEIVIDTINAFAQREVVPGKINEPVIV